MAVENKRQLLNLALHEFYTIMFSSSSEESEDDDEEIFPNLFAQKQHIPRIQNYFEVIVPQYTDQQFKSHFRIFPQTFEFVLELISPKLIRMKAGYQMIPPGKQLLIAIWRMATPDSYRSICEKFGVGRATAIKSVRRVVKALTNLSPVFITWPNEENAIEISNGFYAISGFPNVIGAIDGTHINIPAPRTDPASYVNRKGHHSIQLQAVCDHQCRFTHCYVGNVGSVHDQRVFRLSEVAGYLNDATKFPNNGHILGDAAYTIDEKLLTPYRDNGHLTERQKNYNYCHASARIAIERSFALLKGRFRSLLTLLDMDRIDLIPNFILACCVLHNICLLRNDQLLDVYCDFLPAPVENHPPVRGAELAASRRGAIKRNNIAQELPLRMA